MPAPKTHQRAVPSVHRVFSGERDLGNSRARAVMLFLLARTAALIIFAEGGIGGGAFLLIHEPSGGFTRLVECASPSRLELGTLADRAFPGVVAHRFVDGHIGSPSMAFRFKEERNCTKNVPAVVAALEQGLMSRAFVKEQDVDNLEELPERPISEQSNNVTEAGLGQIEDALAKASEAYAVA